MSAPNLTRPSVRYAALSSGRPELVPQFARHLETLGYARLWLTEHHSARQSASPLVMAALVASQTTQLCVGTAGVMLRYSTPLRIAKDAHVLERLFPGRLDLGVVSGPAPRRALHTELAGDTAGEWHPDAFRQLASLVHDPDQPLSDGLAANLCRSETTLPRLWFCSNSPAGATLAAETGAGLIFHLPFAGPDGIGIAQETITAYRNSFTPSSRMTTPQVAMVVAGCCAASAEHAHDMWPRILAQYTHPRDRASIATSDGQPLDTFFLGSAECAHSHIQQLVGHFALDEVVLACAADSVDAVLSAYSLLHRARIATTGVADILAAACTPLVA